MIELIKPFGFTSFWQLYEDLVGKRLAGEKSVCLARMRTPQPVNKRTISKPIPEPIEEVVLELEYIKARAFDEIYAECYWEVTAKWEQIGAPRLWNYIADNPSSFKLKPGEAICPKCKAIVSQIHPCACP